MGPAVAPPSPGGTMIMQIDALDSLVHEVAKSGTLLGTYISGGACLGLSVRFFAARCLGVVHCLLWPLPLRPVPLIIH